MSINLQQIKVGLICGIAGGALFGLIYAIFNINDLKGLALVSGIGAFSGLLAAPELSPKTFKKPKLFQSMSGALSGLLLGIAFQWSIEWCILVTLIGSFIGYTAKYWINHVQIP